MLILDVPGDALAKEDDLVRRKERIAGNSWSVQQRRGKLRRLRGEPQGLDDLRAAAAGYRAVFSGDTPDELVTPAVMLLQAGDAAAARDLLLQARRQLEQEVAEGGADPRVAGPLVEVCFLLGDDEAAEQACEAAREVDAAELAGTRHPAVAAVSRARRTGDAEAAEAAARELGALARNESAGTYTGSGPMTPWDLYEQALLVVAHLRGDVPAGLREI